MRSAQPATVIIACPHCGTRYQLPVEALGPRGRTVACAHCAQTWLAEVKAAVPPLPPPAPSEPDDDRLFDVAEEEALDRQFSQEEKSAIADVPPALRPLLPKGEKPAPEVMRSIAEIKALLFPKKPEKPQIAPAALAVVDAARQAALDKRQRDMSNNLPAARLLRVIRVLAVVLLLALIVGGVMFRTEIVRLLPDLAGAYSAVGLGVNVVGLEFSDVTTVVSRRAGGSVINVHANIHGVEAARVPVPPVVVTLVDDKGAALYQWSTMPRAVDIAPGEVIDFSTELANPPEAATEVRLGFADGRPRADANIQPEGTAK